MIKKIIITLWIFLAVCVLACVGIFYSIAQGWIGYMPPVEDLENPNYKFATEVLSADGKVLGTYSYVPTGEKTNVTFKQSSKDDYGHSEYYKNSTTSMFYIYTSTSSSTDRNYCVFGELADDESKQALEDLLDAIDDYQSDNELDSFTEEHEVTIRDEFVSGGSYEATFDVPAAKVVITSVEVNKY